MANLAQGSRIQVLAAAQADEKGVSYYYLVRSASGLLGWSNVRKLFEKRDGLP